VLAGTASLAVALGLARPSRLGDAAPSDRSGALSWLRLRPGANDVVAPWSVFAAVGMLAVGADEDTRRRLIAALELPAADYDALRDLIRRLGSDGSSPGRDVRIANVLYTRDPARIPNDQRRRLTDDFRCVVASVPDAKEAVRKALDGVGLARDAGNAMFAPSQSFGVVNVLNVTSAWRRPFDPQATAVLPFHAPHRTVGVPFMRQAGTFAVTRTGASTTISLPFADGSRMVVYAPVAADALSHAWERDAVVGTVATGSSPEEQVVLALPKFHVESTVRFGAELQRAAQLQPSGRIYGWPAAPLDAAHLARVTVDEHGASIVAATSIRHPKKKSRTDVIMVDRPFGFVVLDTTGTIVLVKGRVFDPAAR
jgi:serine protease inhibitor